MIYFYPNFSASVIRVTARISSESPVSPAKQVMVLETQKRGHHWITEHWKVSHGGRFWVVRKWKRSI